LTQTTYLPRWIHGIDFSAAEDAGRRSWITSGVRTLNGLAIQSCRAGELLPGSGRARATCLEALRDFVAMQRDAAIGMDFPFGLPRALVNEPTWLEFVVAFPSRFPSPAAFKATCFTRAGHCELRRQTDRQARTPWAPYNLRLYRQTYFGIACLLGPMVEAGCISVLPMQTPRPQRPWVLEICPASSLKTWHGLARSPYKGRPGVLSARAAILTWLDRQDDLTIPPDVRSTVLGNESGDALDSLIAAYTTNKVVARRACLQPVDPVSALEGYVYV
jgi:Protein of unknown function (DUF429)